MTPLPWSPEEIKRVTTQFEADLLRLAETVEDLGFPVGAARARLLKLLMSWAMSCANELLVSCE